MPYDNRHGSRALVIGLDGGTFDLLTPLMKDGYMPNLKRMVENGVSGELLSTIPPVTAPAWSSFMTGKNPDKHGVLGFLEHNRITGDSRIVDSTDVNGRTLWRILSEKGKRVGVVNVPMTYPPEQVNGFIISGMMTPSLQSSFTFPDGLRDELLKRFPNYDFAITHEHVTPLMKMDWIFDRFVNSVEELMQTRGAAAIWLMRKYDWDFFIVHFLHTDILQHAFWSYLEGGGKGSPARSRTRRLIQVYRNLDGCISAILREADQAGVVKIVMSDHGFQPNHGILCPNRLLADWGFLSDRGGSRLARYLRGFGRLLGPSAPEHFQFARASWHFLAHRTSSQTFVRSLLGNAARQCVVGASSDAAYVKSMALAGFVFLDRANSGSRAVAEQLDRLRGDLASRFASVRTDDQGTRAFRRIYTGEQLYPNTPKEYLPDLVLLPKGGYRLSERIDHPLADPDRPFVGHVHRGMGTHAQNGVLIMQGPGMRRGTWLESPRIVDLAPTILHAMGLPIPDDMDGKPLRGAFVSSAEPVYESVARASRSASSHEVHTDRDARKVKDRLRKLGYLD